MGTPTVTRWITAEQFARDRAFEHNHYILNGEAFTDRGNAHRSHEIVKAKLHEELVVLLRRAGLKARACAETTYEFDNYSVLIPDVSVQIPERPGGEGFFQASPEIVAEILSPSNSKREIDAKARVYWAHGSEAVWVLDPERCQGFSITRTGEWLPVERLTAESLGSLGVDVVSLWPESV